MSRNSEGSRSYKNIEEQNNINIINVSRREGSSAGPGNQTAHGSGDGGNAHRPRMITNQRHMQGAVRDGGRNPRRENPGPGGGRMPGGNANPGGGRVPGGNVNAQGNRMPGGNANPGGGRVPGGNVNAQGNRMPGGNVNAQGNRMPGGNANPQGRRMPVPTSGSRNHDRRNLDRINRESGRPNRRRGRRKGNPVGGVLVGMLLLLVLAGAGSWFYISSLAYKVCRAEAGTEVKASDFMKNGDKDAVFAKGSDVIDTGEPGEYHVKVKSGLFTHSCTLIVEDTRAPQAQPVQVRLPVGNSCGPESFVSDIQDATEVTVTFGEQPDFSQKGTQPVQIVLTDRGNNRTVINTELYLSIVADDVTVEAGQGAPGLDRFVAAGETGEFVTDLSQIDYTKIGDYPVELFVNGESYTSVMHVEDTIPPVVEVQDIEDFAFVPKRAEDFACRIEDVTEVTASFKKEPDLSLTGTQEVELIFTDAGNNSVEKKARLTLKEDTEAPVIHGAVDLVIYAGDSVSYKKDITVTDNATDGITLDVDTSKVNTREEGVYPVTYVASDAAGNSSSVTVNLTVKARLYDIDEVNALGDSVLAKIINENMTGLEKVEAIYTYIMGHISYINDSDKGDWVQAAYEGLMNRKGDCYVYASTAKLLLTRAGITNMDIEKIPSDTLHYWNLVDLGEGWYHFDTTPRKDHPRIFMWDDRQMMEYSESHDKSHNYDHSLYPKVNGSSEGREE